jgi:hypothetical protein
MHRWCDGVGRLPAFACWYGFRARRQYHADVFDELLWAHSSLLDDNTALKSLLTPDQKEMMTAYYEAKLARSADEVNA